VTKVSPPAESHHHRERNPIMGVIGEPQREIEFEPIEAPVEAPEPEQVPVPEEVPA
jgi:hypothetical protein